MQKLSYINLLGERIDLMHAPYVLAKIAGLGMPDIDVNVVHGAYQQGDTAVSLRREARTVTATIHLMAPSRAALYGHRMHLLSVLSPDKAFNADGGRGLLIYQNDYGVWQTDAVPESGLEASKRVQDIQPSIKLQFRCESPYWYNTAEKDVALAWSGEGFAFPFSFPIKFGRREYSREVINMGQVACPVMVTIIGEGEIPGLYNATTGKYLSLASAVPSGSTLTLNTDPADLRAEIDDDSGEIISAFGKLSTSTPLADFTLRPGPNLLRYVPIGISGSHTEIRVKWRERYEGV